MPKEVLRVLARGRALVPDYERAQNDKRNAFLGWSCQPIGPEFTDPETGSQMRHAGFVKRIGGVVSVPVRAEYLRHLRDGDLWPADIQTAQIACVKFDPAYGGEHTEEEKANQKSDLDELEATKGTGT